MTATVSDEVAAGPTWLKSMGFTPVKGCDGWRKRMFSTQIGQMVTVIVPESVTEAQATKELERWA